MRACGVSNIPLNPPLASRLLKGFDQRRNRQLKARHVTNEKTTRNEVWLAAQHEKHALVSANL